jgi:hypothetical protein
MAYRNKQRSLKMKVRSWWEESQWFVLAAVGITALSLGYWGFLIHSRTVNVTRTVLDHLYLTLGLISMNTGAVEGPVSWQLQVARFLVPSVTAYTALRAFAALFVQQSDRIRLWFFRDHLIICGLGSKGYRLASQFLEEGRKVAVVEIDADNDWISSIRTAGAVVIQGDATDPELLRKIRINRANHLIAVLAEDSDNAEVAVQAERMSRSRRTGCLNCKIHIFDSRLWFLLREREFEAWDNDHYRLELFNIFKQGAQRMLDSYPFRKTPGGAGDHHLLIIGLGKLGQSLLVEAALRWRRGNYTNRGKLHISAVDFEAEKKIGALEVQFPQLSGTADLHPLDMDVRSPAFHSLVAALGEQTGILPTHVYICLDNEPLSLHSALTLNQQLDRETPIVMRMAEAGGLSRLLKGDTAKRSAYGSLKIFNLQEKTLTPKLLLYGTYEILARSLHQSYLEGQGVGTRRKPRKASELPWEQLTPVFRERNRRQAQRLPRVLAAAGYRINPLRDWEAESYTFQEGAGERDEITLMAAVEHELWCQEHRSQGWKNGAERDQQRKIHPNLVSWDELDQETREKNKQFLRELPVILARAGFQVTKSGSTEDPLEKRPA